MSTIYLDNNATTRMADEVAALMRDNLALYGNASSMHSLGRDAYSGIDWAREMCASLISSDKDEILFTSGASESNNTVFNTARELIDAGSKRDRIVTTTVEHPSIIETVKYLKSLGYRIDECPVDRQGRLRLDDFERLMGPDVLLVSIMTGNNETGTIQPVGEAARLAHACGALVHSDATQAIGKIPVSVKDLDVDYLSLSAHKFYGPKGVGVLYVRKGSPISPFVHGGHQEGGLRAGTYNNLGIIGLGEAARLALLTTAPWFLAGLYAYLCMTCCLLEPRPRARLLGLLLGGGLCAPLLIRTAPGSLAPCLPAFLLLMPLLVIGLLLPALHYRHRRTE